MKSTLNNGQDDGCLGIARWTVGVVLFFIFYFPFFGFWILDFGGGSASRDFVSTWPFSNHQSP